MTWTAVYRSRYASRFRNYAYGDYYDLCLNAFDRYYYSYCGGYGGYYNPYIVVRGSVAPRAAEGKVDAARRKTARSRSCASARGSAGDRTFPHAGAEPARDAARRERMLRDARPRVEPQIESRSAPRVYRPPSQPSASQPVQRSEPRALPRAEPRRASRRRRASARRAAAAPHRCAARATPVAAGQSRRTSKRPVITCALVAVRT